MIKRRTKEGHLGPKEGHLEKEGQKKDKRRTFGKRRTKEGRTS